MNDDFFSQPILNSPYEYPAKHWELDGDGQPTNRRIASRRASSLITPVPRAKKQRGFPKDQAEMNYGMDEGVRGVTRRHGHSSWSS